MKHLFGIVLIVCGTLALFNVSFGKSQETPIERSKSKPFEILYFETLPEVELQKSEAPPLDELFRVPALTWSFDAFGKPFRISLEANTRLTAKIPTQKRAQIEQTLKLYRGTLDGIPGSWVRLTRVGRQWSGMIWDGEEAYIIDPLSVMTPALQTVPAEPSSGYAMYRLSDTRDLGNRTCGMGEIGGIPAHPMTNFGALMEELQDQVGITAQGATRNIDMTVVTDPQFHNANSNPEAAVIARMNVVDGIFSEQLGIQISLVDVLPLQNNGGLTSTNAGTLLDQFSQLTNSASFNHPGVAHLFTGRNLDGSTVGAAYLRSLCSARFGIGINQIIGTGTAGALTVAHELGHNFGAPHDNENGSPCATTPETFLMNPFLNGNDQFSPCSLSQIQPVVNSASCLTFINIDQADLQPRFQRSTQEAPVGQPFSSLLSVTNNGQGAAFNARAVISIPNGLSLDNAITNSGSCTGIGSNQATCTLNTISPGAERVITLTLNSTTAGTFPLMATSFADNDSNPSNNTSQATITIGTFPPPISFPPPSTTLSSTSVTFTGGHTSVDVFHSLWAGTTIGGFDLHRGPMTNHRQTVSSLPTTGTIFVRYWSTKSPNSSDANAWFFTDQTYSMAVGSTGGPFPPPISTPAPNTLLTSPSVTFTGGHTAIDVLHSLWVGSTPGGFDLHRGPMTNHRQTVSSLPTTGTIFVRYWSTKSPNSGDANAWFFTDQTFTMGGMAATDPSPLP